MNADESPFLTFLFREGEELRRRLLWCLAAVGLVFGVLMGLPSWDDSFSLHLASAFQRSLLPSGSQLVFLDPMEPMLAVAKLTLAISLVACLPVLLWHALAFTAPAFAPGLRIYYVRLVLLAFCLLGLGLWLGWKFLLPLTLRMLLDYGQTAAAQAMLSFDRFYAFTFLVLFAFALPFETPLLMSFLHRFNVLSASTMRAWRFKVWGCFIILSQFVTPDPLLTPLLFSLACILLYEIGLLLAGLNGKR